MSDGSSSAASGGGSSGDVPSGAAPVSGSSGGKSCTRNAPILKLQEGGKPTTPPVTTTDVYASWPSRSSARVAANAQVRRLKQALVRAQKHAPGKQNTTQIVELHGKIALAEEVLATITALLAREQVG